MHIYNIMCTQGTILDSKLIIGRLTPFLRETEENAVTINRAIEEFNSYLCKQYLGLWDRENERVKIRPKTSTDKIR